MLLWLPVVILSYLFFGLASFGDKLVLSHSQSPKLYTFYVGCLGLLSVCLIPFVGFYLPDQASFFWINLTSLTFVAGLYGYYYTVDKFDVSRVVSISGSVQPVFILLLSWIFWNAKVIQFNNLIAFILLLIATIIISFEKGLALNKRLIVLSLFTSFIVALSLVFMKVVFLHQEFFQGIIWIGIFNFLFVLIFFFNANFRDEFFIKKSAFDKKTLLLVGGAQIFGGLAGFLYNYAIFLVPVASLAILNALRGVQYVFIFLTTLFFSVFYPAIFKEKISKQIIIQRSISLVLIALALAMLIY